MKQKYQNDCTMLFAEFCQWGAWATMGLLYIVRTSYRLTEAAVGKAACTNRHVQCCYCCCLSPVGNYFTWRCESPCVFYWMNPVCGVRLIMGMVKSGGYISPVTLGANYKKSKKRVFRRIKFCFLSHGMCKKTERWLNFVIDGNEIYHQRFGYFFLHGVTTFFLFDACPSRFGYDGSLNVDLHGSWIARAVLLSQQWKQYCLGTAAVINVGLVLSFHNW